MEKTFNCDKPRSENNSNKDESNLDESNRDESNRDESNRDESNRDESNRDESNRDVSIRDKSNRNETNQKENLLENKLDRNIKNETIHDKSNDFNDIKLKDSKNNDITHKIVNVEYSNIKDKISDDMKNKNEIRDDKNTTNQPIGKIGHNIFTNGYEKEIFANINQIDEDIKENEDISNHIVKKNEEEQRHEKDFGLKVPNLEKINQKSDFRSDKSSNENKNKIVDEIKNVKIVPNFYESNKEIPIEERVENQIFEEENEDRIIKNVPNCSNNINFKIIKNELKDIENDAGFEDKPIKNGAKNNKLEENQNKIDEKINMPFLGKEIDQIVEGKNDEMAIFQNDMLQKNYTNKINKIGANEEKDISTIRKVINEKNHVEKVGNIEEENKDKITQKINEDKSNEETRNEDQKVSETKTSSNDNTNLRAKYDKCEELNKNEEINEDKSKEETKNEDQKYCGNKDFSIKNFEGKNKNKLTKNNNEDTLNEDTKNEDKKMSKNKQVFSIINNENESASNEKFENEEMQKNNEDKSKEETKNENQKMDKNERLFSIIDNENLSAKNEKLKNEEMQKMNEDKSNEETQNLDRTMSENKQLSSINDSESVKNKNVEEQNKFAQKNNEEKNYGVSKNEPKNCENKKINNSSNKNITNEIKTDRTAEKTGVNFTKNGDNFEIMLENETELKESCALLNKKTNEPKDIESTGTKTNDDTSQHSGSTNTINPLFFEELDETSRAIKEGIFDISKSVLFLQLFSILVYMVDVVSDQSLAITYFINKNVYYGIFTLSFVCLPSLWITYRGQLWRGVKNRTKLDWFLLVFIYLFNLEPVAQYYDNYKICGNYLKAKKEHNEEEQKKNYDLLVSRKRDVAQLRYWEGVLEAIPQLILQLYILLNNYDNLVWNRTLSLQLVSLGTSSLGLATTFFNYGKTWVILKGIKMSLCAHIWRCMRWYLPMVSRVISIVVLSLIHPGYTLIVLGIHLVLAIVWRYHTHKQQGIVVVIVQSLIDVIISRDDTFLYVCISNALLFVEDVLMVLVWAFTVEGNITVLRIPLVTVCVVLGVVGRLLHVHNKWILINVERKMQRQWW